MNLLLTGALAVLLLAAFSSAGAGEGMEAEASDYARRVLISSSLKIDQGQLLGPESIEFDNHGFIYVSVGDGSIRRVNPVDYTETVYAYSVNLADRTYCGQAGNATAEAICGRPLGLKFDRHYNLYVADAYYGLLFVPRRNPAHVTVLANSSGGVKFGFTNALVINKAETSIYLVDTSPTDPRSAFVAVFLEAKPQGRLIHYNIRTGKTTTLLSNLVFGNGIAFNRHETEVIINETSLKRVRRYYLSGPKAGQDDFFNSDIGGYPDNVQYDCESGFFLIGCYSQADPATDAIIANNTHTQTNANTKASPSMQTHTYNTQTQTNANTTVSPGWIVVMDHKGAVQRTLYDPTGANVAYTSEAHRHGKYIYVGSVENPFLNRIPASLLPWL